MKLKEIITRAAGYIADHKLLLTVLYVFSVFSIADIPSSPAFKMAEWLQCIYLICVSGFKAVAILALFYPLFKFRYGKVVIGCITAIYGLLASINIVSFTYYRFGITRKLILVFAQTTPKEASEFLPGLFHNLTQLLHTPGFYISLALVAVAIFALRILPRKIIGGLALCVAAIGLGAFLAFGIRYTTGRSAHLLTARLVKYGKEVYQANEEYKLLLTQKRPLPYKETVKSRHLASTVVVVIGESAHRRHLSLYGYPLPTTPSLDAMADSLTIFTDVIGSSMSTADNMERILSFKQDDSIAGDGLKYPLVIDLFKEMGYKTFWLSNQERSGSVSNTSGVMAMNSDVTKYVGADNSEDALSLRYDEALLEPLSEALSDTACNKLIFLHLLGSHVEYKCRYPERFNRFTGRDEADTFGFEWLDDNMSQRRAEYDNSILYTDYILSDVISDIARADHPAFMIYFSDHGEEVYDFSSYSGRNANTVQVPFIVFANNTFAEANPDLMKRLNEVRDTPMSSANLVHLLITLTGGSYHFYDPTLDVMSSSYRLRPRYVDEGLWEYDTLSPKSPELEICR